MKIRISKNKLSINPEQFLRQAGYGFIIDRRRGQESFIRRLGNYHYPRLHMYVDKDNDFCVFNLHLDQKQASYAGAHMHNAEYDGEIVEGEINRLKGLLNQYVSGEKEVELGGDNALGNIGKGDYNQVLASKENSLASSLQKGGQAGQEKSWWKRIFS